MIKIKKTEDTIKAKRAKKFMDLKNRTEKNNKINIINLKSRFDKFIDYKIQKINKKKDAYLKKKEEEYKRKMLNEIRELKGNKVVVYKDKKWTRNKKLQFALAIAQENSKLRDTNPDWDGICISCNRLCSWKELAWGHLYSRMFQGICLFKININAQCRNCNFTTWPKGSTLEKEITNKVYRINLIKKYSKEQVEEMEERLQQYISNPKKYSVTEIYLNEYIPELIEENEKLRATKNFYKPSKNWRRIYEAANF